MLITTIFFFNDTATTEIYTLSLHDALPISGGRRAPAGRSRRPAGARRPRQWADRQPARPLRSAHRSEEDTSELQSPCNLGCRLLLEKKKTMYVGRATTSMISSTSSIRAFLD